MAGHFLRHTLNNLTGVLEGGGAQYIQQPLIAKLLLLRVLGFVQAIGVDKERTPADGIDFLARVLYPREEADGRIGLYFKEMATLTFQSPQHGRVMPGIAETEIAGGKVEQSDKHGDEHALIVVLGQFVVQPGGYLCGCLFHQCQCAESACGYGHDERGGYTLSADVADAEI